MSFVLDSTHHNQGCLSRCLYTVQAACELMQRMCHMLKGLERQHQICCKDKLSFAMVTCCCEAVTKATWAELAPKWIWNAFVPVKPEVLPVWQVQSL